MTPAGIEPATFRFVAQHLNHCATAVPSKPTCKVLNLHHAMNMCKYGGVAPRIVNLSTRQRWVVSFTNCPLYPRVKISPCLLHRKVVGPRASLNVMAKRKTSTGKITAVAQSTAY